MGEVLLGLVPLRLDGFLARVHVAIDAVSKTDAAVQQLRVVVLHVTPCRIELAVRALNKRPNVVFVPRLEAAFVLLDTLNAVGPGTGLGAAVVGCRELHEALPLREHVALGLV